MNSALDRFERSLVDASDRLSERTVHELLAPGTSPPPRRRWSSRRRMLIGAAASFAVAGAAAGVVLVVSGGGSTDSTWDQHVLRAAEIALPTPAPNTIVHISATQTMTPSARGDSNLLVPTLDAEGWFQQGAPYRSLTREQVPGQTPTWQTGSRIYDPATRRVYVHPPFPSSHPRFTQTKTSQGDTVTLQIATAYGPVRATATAAQIRALHTGADLIEWSESWNGHRLGLGATVIPSAPSSMTSLDQQPSSQSLSFPAQLHRLLQSGHARVAGRVTVDGRRAITIAISGVPGYQRSTYYVDPTTYKPIELDNYGVHPNDLTRLVFHTDQQLPLKDNTQLLRLHTPAGTTVDHNPGGYYGHIPPLVIW
jgi:hypothetical protein